MLGLLVGRVASSACDEGFEFEFEGEVFVVASFLSSRAGFFQLRVDLEGRGTCGGKT